MICLEKPGPSGEAIVPPIISVLGWGSFSSHIGMFPFTLETDMELSLIAAGTTGAALGAGLPEAAPGLLGRSCSRTWPPLVPTLWLGCVLLAAECGVR